MKTLRLVCWSILICALLQSSYASVGFEDFKSNVKPSSTAAKIDLSSKFARKFKTILSNELAEGPNFSGKYRIPQIGCGAGCAEIAIIDCETGKVFDPKLHIDGAHEWVNPDKVEFRSDSSLLILRGCLNEKADQCGTHYFRWTGKKLELIQFIPVK